MQWTKDLDRIEDKEQFMESLRLSSHVLDRLAEILEERREGLRRSMENTKYFIMPSWSQRQASALGELRNIQYILDLIKT